MATQLEDSLARLSDRQTAEIKRLREINAVLLEALKRLEGYNYEDSAKDYHDALIQARVAIIKASEAQS